MRLSLGLGLLIIATFFYPFEIAYASQTLIVDEQARAALWDRGSLEIMLTTHPWRNEKLIVGFSGKRSSKLHSLTLSTANWRIDLSGYVAKILFPFPNRISISVGSVGKSGTVDEVVLQLPYLLNDPAKEMSEPQCAARVIFIKAGHVTDSDDIQTSLGRCSP